MNELHKKYSELLSILQEYRKTAIAFSSGVDSTFLLKAAKQALGDQVLALTARSCFFPEKESKESAAFCNKEDIRQIFIDIDEFSIPEIKDNPPNRCYICKRALFTQFIKTANENDFNTVCEGSNVDDMSDYRPGLKAIAELDIKSPLRQANLSKAEIRALSKELGLNTWSKPSFACLASRFPYGESISKKALKQVEQAEILLEKHGFRQFRVRIHNTLARIEVLPEDFEHLIKVREEIYSEFHRIGFDYSAMDLMGYRQGSMNETIQR